jgi:hypothetical protein
VRKGGEDVLLFLPERLAAGRGEGRGQVLLLLSERENKKILFSASVADPGSVKNQDPDPG